MTAHLGTSCATTRATPLNLLHTGVIFKSNPGKDATKDAPHSESCLALALATMDALEGRRHIETLRRWFPPSIFTSLRRQAIEFAAQNPQRMASMVCKPLKMKLARTSPTHLEVALTVISSRKIKAVAIAMDREHHGRWLVSAFETR